jgi:D-alanine-D-alanine ligase
MKVGLTYDLRDEYLSEGMDAEESAEFDRPDTIDAIESTLRSLGFKTDRIGNIKQLTARLSSGDRWDIVFNIAEGVSGFGREAQVPALLDAWRIPYTFSDPLVLCITLHKAVTKRIIRDLGLPTTDFALIEEASDISQVNLPFPIFAKPVSEGTGKGVTKASKIVCCEGLEKVCKDLLERYKQPVLLEPFLLGREFTVGIIGTGKEARSVGVLEVIIRPRAESDIYSYTNKELYEELVTYRIAQDIMAGHAADIALRSWRGLGCRDAGRVDLRADSKGMPNFIEVNPLAGLHPEHSDLPILCTKIGISYKELINGIMESALRRQDKHTHLCGSIRPPLNRSVHSLN